MIVISTFPSPFGASCFYKSFSYRIALVLSVRLGAWHVKFYRVAY